MTLNRIVPKAPGDYQEAATGKRPALLYVEDEDINWDVASKRLRTRYRVERAKNSQEAFDYLASTTFDAVLMDIQLHNSEYDGIQITRILLGKSPVKPPPQLANLNVVPPIIFVTAYSARYTKEELMTYGGSDLITKPVDFVELTLALTRIIMKGLKKP